MITYRGQSTRTYYRRVTDKRVLYKTANLGFYTSPIIEPEIEYINKYIYTHTHARIYGEGEEDEKSNNWRILVGTKGSLTELVVPLKSNSGHQTTDPSKS